MTSDEASSVAASSEQTERRVAVQGVATHLFEAGPPTAPTLLYLHGLFLGHLWLEYHHALAQHFHLLAPHIPGFGLTKRPDWMRDMSDYILYFRDFLDELGLDQVLLVGHSLGGWMAAELAVWYPERVKKLVLSNAAGIRVKGRPSANLFAMNVEELIRTLFDNPMAALPLMPAAFDIDFLLTQYRERTTLASLAWNPEYDPKLERRLAWIKCPTLILWGHNDRLIPPAYADAFHQQIPQCEVVKLEGTGHMPMFEKQEEWSNAICEFLNRSTHE